MSAPSVLRALLRDEGGATLTEYALVLAMIAGASIVALQGLAGAMSAKLVNLAGSLSASQSGP